MDLEPTLLRYLIDNFLLVALAVVSGALLLWPSLIRHHGANAIDSIEATRLINQKQAILIDIREPEVRSLGSIPQAKHISAADISKPGKNLLQSFSKEKPLILLGDKTAELKRIIHLLKSMGFVDVYTLAGGINAWQQAGFPVKKLTT